MVQTYSSGYKIKLTAKLTSTATNLTADTDVGVTSGRLYFKNDDQEEWISFTGVSSSGSNYSYTGLTRGLSQTADPATAGTGKTWVAGSEGLLVAMHDQLFDRQQPRALTFATTAARDTALGADGAATEPYANIYVTSTGFFYNYNLSTNQWETIDTGTTTPNGSTTAAGVFEEATVAEQGASTATGGTGARLTLACANVVKTSAGAGDENKLAVLNASGEFDNSFLATVKTSSGAGDEDSIAILNASGQFADGFINETIGITGELRLWTTDTPPTGWLIANGSAISRTTYANLFSVIGTTYGVGNGTSTFNIPDLRGRTPVGKDVGTFSSLGDTGGEETHTLTSTEIPAHTHIYNETIGGGTGGNILNGSQSPQSSANTSSYGGGLAHNNLQPYQVFNFIIKT